MPGQGGGGPVIQPPLKTTKRFERDVKKLDAGAVAALKTALERLLQDPKPASLHFHKMNGYDDLYCIHVTAADTHKVSMQVDGSTATLRRYGTHKEIDASP